MDSFAISWKSLYFYAFPPICQIHRCLQTILEEQVLQGIMILPLQSTQIWWPQLLEMLIEIPFVLPKQGDLMSLSHTKLLKEDIDYAGMSIAWQSIQDRGISEAAAKLIMASWRDGTKK